MFALSRVAARITASSKSHRLFLFQRGTQIASLPPCTDLLRANSSSGSPIGEDQAKAGTEAWVREWVIEQGMCPYAIKSKYKIVPFCSDASSAEQFSEKFKHIFRQEVGALFERVAEREYNELVEIREEGDDLLMPCTLLVFPNYKPFENIDEFETFYHELSNPFTQGLFPVMCEPMHLYYGIVTPLVAQIFHPKMDNSTIEAFSELSEDELHIANEFAEGTAHPYSNFIKTIPDTSVLKYTKRSPWPTMQILARSDLENAWWDDDYVYDSDDDDDYTTDQSQKILMKNAKTFSEIGSEELEKQLESFRNT